MRKSAQLEKTAIPNFKHWTNEMLKATLEHNSSKSDDHPLKKAVQNELKGRPSDFQPEVYRATWDNGWYELRDLIKEFGDNFPKKYPHLHQMAKEKGWYTDPRSPVFRMF
jgi:hypothetical protein